MIYGIVMTALIAAWASVVIRPFLFVMWHALLSDEALWRAPK